MSSFFSCGSAAAVEQEPSRFQSGQPISQYDFVPKKVIKDKKNGISDGVCASIATFWMAAHDESIAQGHDTAEWRFGHIKKIANDKAHVKFMNEVNASRKRMDVATKWIEDATRKGLQKTAAVVVEESSQQKFHQQVTAQLSQPGYAMGVMNLDINGQKILHWLAFHTRNDAGSAGEYGVRMMDPDTGEMIALKSEAALLVDESLANLKKGFPTITMDSLYIYPMGDFGVTAPKKMDGAAAAASSSSSSSSSSAAAWPE